MGVGDGSPRGASTVIYGAVLVGGKSARMGRAKQRLGFGGSTFSERAVSAMRRHLELVVLAGSGSVPKPLAGLLQLPDAPAAA